VKRKNIVKRFLFLFKTNNNIYLIYLFFNIFIFLVTFRRLTKTLFFTLLDWKYTTKYKIQVFRLPFDGRTTEGLSPYGRYVLSPFLRSDHVSFWDERTSNRAIFLSDTADMRSYMRSCYHKDCDSLSHVTPDFLGFLSKSCDAIVMTTNDLTNNTCEANVKSKKAQRSAGIWDWNSCWIMRYSGDIFET
jgi:hypothetical protein